MSTEKQYPPLPPLAQGPYVPHDTISETGSMAIMGLGAGFFTAAIKNALERRNVGVFGVFTRHAPVMGLSAVAPAAYMFFSRSTWNLMEHESTLGAAIGGFATGGVFGLPYKSLPRVMSLGTFTAVTMSAIHLWGGRINSFREEEDEFARKEIMRRTTRIPVEQTVAELGEGKEIKAPGYEERRRERLKEKFGVEINPVKATVDGSS